MFNFEFFKKPMVKRLYDLDGIATIEAKFDGRVWSPIEQWCEFQKAVEHSGVITDSESYVRVGFHEEIYVVLNFKPSLGFTPKLHVFIRFANGAWGEVDSSVVQGTFNRSLDDDLNPHKLAGEIYQLIGEDLEFGAAVIQNCNLLEGHYIRFEYNGIMGRTTASEMTIQQMFAHVVERNSIESSWGVRKCNSSYLELLVVGLLVGQAHAGHVVLKLIPEDFMEMFS